VPQTPEFNTPDLRKQPSPELILSSLRSSLNSVEIKDPDAKIDNDIKMSYPIISNKEKEDIN